MKLETKRQIAGHVGIVLLWFSLFPFGYSIYACPERLVLDGIGFVLSCLSCALFLFARKSEDRLNRLICTVLLVFAGLLFVGSIGRIVDDVFYPVEINIDDSGKVSTD